MKTVDDEPLISVRSRSKIATVVGKAVEHDATTRATPTLASSSVAGGCEERVNLANVIEGHPAGSVALIDGDCMLTYGVVAHVAGAVDEADLRALVQR